MDEYALQERIRALQETYTQMLTQAAQEGRTEDVQTMSKQMQQEIQALQEECAQTALSNVDAGSASAYEESEEYVEELEVDSAEEEEDGWEEEDDEEEEEDDDWEEDEK